MTVALRMDAFDVQKGSVSGWLVLVKGDPCYKDILRRAFPDFSFTHSFPDKKGIYDWGTYVHDLADPGTLEKLLMLLCDHLHLPNDLDECMALDWHKRRSSDRTELGELIYQAKYRRCTNAADQVRNRLLSFITSHPTYARADAIVPVPASVEGASQCIPDLLAQGLAQQLDKAYGGSWMHRRRITRP